MKSLTLLSVILLGAASLLAQDATPAASKAKYVSTIGEVLSVDGGAKQVKVKTDKGEEFTIPLQDNTSYLRMPPGETALTKATRIEMKDIAVGDRVLARTHPAEGTAMSPAVSVIVMTKADLAQFHEKSRAEWDKRGTVGTVTALDAATKAITITVPNGLTPKDVKTLTIDPADKVVYRRYAGSARFEDAKPSAFNEIQVGDKIRVLGDKSEDGLHIKPEEIISGTFRTLAVTIASIDTASNSMKVNDLSTKKPYKVLTIKLNADSSIKRLPQMMAMRLAAMQNGGAAGGPGAGGPGAGGAGGGRPQGAPAGAGGPGAGGAGGGMRGGAANLPKMIEGLPPIGLVDLKAGDALVISGIGGGDAPELTATTALAGVEAILTAPSKGGQQSAIGGSWSFGDVGMPQ